MREEDKALLDNWVENKLAVADAGDGAWGWSKKGLAIDPIVRMYLSQLLYKKIELELYQVDTLDKAGFNNEGYFYETRHKSYYEYTDGCPAKMKDISKTLEED